MIEELDRKSICSTTTLCMISTASEQKTMTKVHLSTKFAGLHYLSGDIMGTYKYIGMERHCYLKIILSYSRQRRKSSETIILHGPLLQFEMYTNTLPWIPGGAPGIAGILQELFQAAIWRMS